MIGLGRCIAACAFAVLILVAGYSDSIGQDSSWNGTWSGTWGGKYSSSIVIANGRVQQYVFGTQTVPVQQQNSTAGTVTFGCTDSCRAYSVTMNRTSANMAMAQFTSPQLGNSQAIFTRK